MRGMRNPKESWGKSDSVFGGEYRFPELVYTPARQVVDLPERPRLGEADLKLAAPPSGECTRGGGR